MLEVDSHDYPNKSKSPIWKLLLPLCGNDRILEEFNHNNQGETTRKGKKEKHTLTKKLRWFELKQQFKCLQRVFFRNCIKQTRPESSLESLSTVSRASPSYRPRKWLKNTPLFFRTFIVETPGGFMYLQDSTLYAPNAYWNIIYNIII